MVYNPYHEFYLLLFLACIPVFDLAARSDVLVERASQIPFASRIIDERVQMLRSNCHRIRC